MGRPQRGRDGTAKLLVDTPLVIEPGSTRWARALRPVVQRISAAGLADAVASLLADELPADHVALWRADGDAFVVLGAAGMTDAARRMRLPAHHPVVHVARGSGGTLLRGTDHHGPRAPGLPGSGSPTYAMVVLDREPAGVDLVTLSGRELDEAAVVEVRRLVAVELADGWTADPGPV